MKNPDREWLKKRLMNVAIIILAAFSLLLLRFVYLQIVEGDEYRRLSENNCIRLQSVPAPRGMIYDRNGTLLVDNIPSFDLKIVLQDAEPVDETIAKLAEFTGITLEELMERVDAGKKVSIYKPIVLKKNITRDQLAVVEAHSFDLPGVRVEIEPMRNYIYKKSAAHLIGYLGEINSQEIENNFYPDVRSGDLIGRYGSERAFEHILHGKRGGKQIEVDASGRLVRVINTVEPIPGKNVFLAIDATLQQKTESIMEGQTGAVVAIDPSNGDVLAMVSSPSFDLNDFIGGISSEKWKALMSDPGKPMSNKAIQGEYPPASTYKIVTAIAALEEEAVDIHTTYFCPGYHKYGNRTYHCWKKWGHGRVNIISALEKSCDVYFYRSGEAIGVDNLAKYANGCGLGKLTHIELANERSGLIPTAAWKKRRFGNSWQGGETLSIAIGQGFNLATPLQMAMFIAAIGNNGTIYRPKILKFTQDYNGSLESRLDIKSEILGAIPASKQTLKIVKEGLLNVVESEGGTAKKIRIEGVDIAGKTGTAQVFSLKKSDRDSNRKFARHLRDHAWFVCYAPAQNPVIAVSVIIEHGEHGSTAAAPVASEVLRTWLQIKGILPSVKGGTI
ncbi:MAG: penicillin-binding protein 2 [Desulfamplus sp.]|nr:penicillin-binding protein 2 [Desulfamplus sp.]